MGRFSFGVGVLAIVIVAASGSMRGASADDGATDIASIKALEERLNSAYLERDWETFSGLFTEDGMWMPPNRLPLVGKEAWWSMIGPFWPYKPVEVSTETEEIILLGDWAIERHNELAVFNLEDGKTRTSRYKGIHILQRQPDGDWKIARYIWNANPAPE